MKLKSVLTEIFLDVICVIVVYGAIFGIDFIHTTYGDAATVVFTIILSAVAVLLWFSIRLIQKKNGTDRIHKSHRNAA